MRPRILIGLKEIAGYYGQLALGLRQLGYPVSFWQLLSTSHRYEAETATPLVMQWIRQFCSWRRDTPWSRPFRKVVGIGLGAVLHFGLFLIALCRFDVFIFSYDSSFLGGWEFWILRLFGKRIICVFNGSESRPPYVDGTYLHRGYSLAKLATMTQKMKRFVASREQAANVIVMVSPHGYFNTKPFIHGMIIGQPCDADRIARLVGSPAARKPDDPVRISFYDALNKGGDEIRGLLDRLGQRYAIEIRPIKGMTHPESLRCMAGSDIVIDQLYSDMALPMMSLEAGALARASIVAGYAYDEPRFSPNIFCAPEALEAMVVSLIEDPEKRQVLGESMQRYVCEEMSAVSVARRFSKLIEGDIPESWWVDPMQTVYLWGVSASRSMICETVRHLTDQLGWSVLQLGDKPDLEAAYQKEVA